MGTFIHIQNLLSWSLALLIHGAGKGYSILLHHSDPVPVKSHSYFSILVQNIMVNCMLAALFLSGYLIEFQVHDLIYHLELAKGAYKDNPAVLCRNSMLRESNVIKFINNSSVMRPAYYIGIDPRKKLVILGIRGTHALYDLITDIASSSDGDVTFDGYSTHFGTAESARWFLRHEIEIIRNILEKHEVRVIFLHLFWFSVFSLPVFLIHTMNCA